jgi:hypothetical protein
MASSKPDGGGLINAIGFDPTKQIDRDTGQFNQPQLQDGWKSYAVWGTRVDNSKQSFYNLRQIMSFPHTLLGVARLPGWLFIGQTIKYSLWLLQPIMGWYIAIPSTIIALVIGCVAYIGFCDREITFSTLLKLSIMTMGGLL